jgi:hypothetical protein
MSEGIGMELSEAYVALATQLQRVLKGLTTDEAISVALGETKLALVRPSEQLLSKSKALDLALKAVNKLGSDDVELIEKGEASLGFVRKDERVLAKSKVLDATLKLLNGLTPEEVEAVERRPASLKVVRAGGKVVYPISHSAIAEEISRLPTESAIIKHLDSDDRLKPADLRRIATELGIAIPKSMKERGDMETYIARNLMSYGMTSA